MSFAMVAIISPCVVVHNLDPHTGIPFMPHMAAQVAGAIYETGAPLQVIDCFGIDCHKRRILDDFMFLGISEAEVLERLNPAVKIAWLYCRTIEDLISTERIAAAIKKNRPDIKIVFFENIQTVNSFSLRVIAEDLIKKHSGIAVFGEGELRAEKINTALLSDSIESLKSIAGISFIENSQYIENADEPFNKNLDLLPFPLWKAFDLEGYWKIGFSHAPNNGRKFLPILTSRGCPFRCTFCVSPAVNPTWRGRSAKSVVDEMQFFYETLGVTDFHVSDLDPTVQDKRTREICLELISRKLPIVWKFAQGTKIETVKSIETIQLLAQSGLTFFSFSPESGSPRMLKIMNKSFDHQLALNYLKELNRLNVRTQACFIAGVPGETKEDQKLSIEYVKQLVKAGVDEIAVTIFTPIPGAALSESMKGFKHYSELTHSPTWRSDYSQVSKFRYKMYLTFFAYKLLFPLKIVREVLAVFTRKFETKMEMSLFKQAKLYLLYFLPELFSKGKIPIKTQLFQKAVLKKTNSFSAMETMGHQ
jgi:anaerobic magnesium-protoporphyrin IX monomethyl ester cyclase